MDTEFQCMKEALCSAFPQIRLINLSSETNVGKAPRSFSLHQPQPRLGINLFYTHSTVFFITPLVPVWHHTPLGRVKHVDLTDYNRSFLAICTWHRCTLNAITPTDLQQIQLFEDKKWKTPGLALPFALDLLDQQNPWAIFSVEIHVPLGPCSLENKVVNRLKMNWVFSGEH